MKHLFSALSVALMISVLALFSSCSNKTAASEEGGAHSAKEEATSSSAGSVVGKWQVVDVTMEGLSKEEEAAMSMMKGMIIGENMTFDFSADGVAKTSSKSMPETVGKYEQSGTTLKVVDDKSGKNESMDIVKATSDSLFIKSNIDGKGMIMKMKKI
jgi:hypothetical protein